MEHREHGHGLSGTRCLASAIPYFLVRCAETTKSATSLSRSLLDPPAIHSSTLVGLSFQPTLRQPAIHPFIHHVANPHPTTYEKTVAIQQKQQQDVVFLGGEGVSMEQLHARLYEYPSDNIGGRRPSTFIDHTHHSITSRKLDIDSLGLGGPTCRHAQRRQQHQQRGPARLDGNTFACTTSGAK